MALSLEERRELYRSNVQDVAARSHAESTLRTYGTRIKCLANFLRDHYADADARFFDSNCKYGIKCPIDHQVLEEFVGFVLEKEGRRGEGDEVYM